MKRPQAPILLAIAVSVFLLSFFIGRATALKSREESKKNVVYTGRMLLPQKEEISLPTGAVSEKIEALKEVGNKKEEKPVQKKEEKKEIKKDEPPERMLFPCGQSVLKGYSQTAVYSKTMDDWRAHMGIDYMAKKGDSVVSVWDGIVKKVYKDNFWGYCIEIEHPGNIISVYKNLEKKILVKEGDGISKGQAIATVGDSAVVEKRDEEHLHFELWVNGETINPQSYIY